MTATEQLHNGGQSLWLDNVPCDLLTSGTLKRYIDESWVTGLPSNPAIFNHAISNSPTYDAKIRKGLAHRMSGDEVFFEMALEDIAPAADLSRPIYNRTSTIDGWVSLEVSPLLAHDAASTVAAARELYARAGRPNVFIKISGTSGGLLAVEKALFAGVPINITLLFSREQYLAAGRGLSERHRTPN